jgi:hypothetical protein
VNKLEAKKILTLYRPGTADETDPSFADARQLTKVDPDLALWFEAHCESYHVLREKFHAVPIPLGLKERILSQGKVDRSLLEKYWAPLLAAAACVALIFGLAAGLGPFHGLTHSYAAYRKRMTETALRNYYMDLRATDPTRVRDFLKAKNAPADYDLPARLKTAPVVGCLVSSWQGSPVSMICFKSGRPLPPGEASDLWLFVTDRKNVPNAPAPGAPVFAHVNKAATASWSDDKQNYLLAAVADESFLGKYIQ